MLVSEAESMFTLCRELSLQEGIDWSRITCFAIDELWDPNLSLENT